MHFACMFADEHGMNNPLQNCHSSYTKLGKLLDVAWVAVLIRFKFLMDISPTLFVT